MNKKAEDPIEFRNKVNEKKRNYEARQRAENPQGFKDKVNQKKRLQEERQTADQRLAKFNRRVQYGPIFVCSSCHQKLFMNQVEEFSEIIKKEIDDADPNIRTKCITEEFLIDLEKDKINSSSFVKF